MKHLIAITTLIVTSTHSIIGMEPESCSYDFYKNLPSRYVTTITPDKPSITIINNDSDEIVNIDIAANGEACTLGLLPTKELKICPYLKSQLSNPAQKSNRTSITLGLRTKRLHCFVPCINGKPTIEITNGYFGDYIKYKNTVYSIDHKQEMDNGITMRLSDSNHNHRHHKKFILDIDGTSPIQCGDTIRIDYDAHKHKLHVIHNNTTTLGSFSVTNDTLIFDDTELIQ